MGTQTNIVNTEYQYLPAVVWPGRDFAWEANLLVNLPNGLSQVSDCGRRWMSDNRPLDVGLLRDKERV